MGQTQQIRGPRRAERRSGQDQDALTGLGQAIDHGAFDRILGQAFQRGRLLAQTRLQPPDQGQTTRRLGLGRQGQHRLQGPLARHPPRRAAQGREHHHAGGRGRLRRLARRRHQGVDVVDVHARVLGVHQAGPQGVALHPLHDAVHDLHRLHRIVAGRGLGRQHQGVGALIDGVGHIRRLGPRRGRRTGHGFQHLCRDDGGHAALAGGAQDLLLRHRHFLRLHLHAQVTARDHDPVAVVEDALQIVQGLGLLDLGHAGGAPVHDPLQLGHVLGLLHEAEGHPVDAEAQGEGQVLAVLGRQGRDRNDRFRHRHALAVRQLGAALDRDVGPFVRAFPDPQADAPVVDQQQHPCAQGLKDFRVRHLHPRLVARLRVQIEAHPVARLDGDLDIGEPAQPQLRPLQVGQNAQRAFQRDLGAAHGLEGGGVVLVRAMAEVQAEDVHPGLGQRLDGRGRTARGSKGRDDARAAGSVHGVSSKRL